MSKAVKTKKFVLVSLEDVEDPKNMQRRMRRYLNGNKLSHIFSSDIDEMKEFLDKIHSQNLSEIAPTPPDDDAPLNNNFEKRPIVNVSSNQEILEKWARETFAADSSELKLLFGNPTPAEYDDDESNGGNSPRDNDEETEHEMFEKEVPKIFSVHSLDSESADSKKDEVQEILQTCLLCNVDVDVGKNRNTKIKRQAQHVIDKHPNHIFVDIRISQRYKCLRCSRVIPVAKSPCEHITEYHMNDDEETEFADLWTKDQLQEFNVTLEKCFGRQLPVPRSRRLRTGFSWFISKAPYRIKQGDDVVKIETLAEKLRPGCEVDQTKNIESGAQASRRPTDSEEVVRDDVSTVNHDHDYDDDEEDEEERWRYRRHPYYDEDDVDDEDEQFYLH